MLNLLPLPNSDPGTLCGYNYVSSYVLSQPRNQETLRMDYNINSKNHLSGRYNHKSETVPYPYVLDNNFTLTLYPAAQTSQNHSNSVTGRLSTTITSYLTNEFNATLTRLVLGTQISNEPAVSRTG